MPCGAPPRNCPRRDHISLRSRAEKQRHAYRIRAAHQRRRAACTAFGETHATREALWRAHRVCARDDRAMGRCQEPSESHACQGSQGGDAAFSCARLRRGRSARGHRFPRRTGLCDRAREYFSTAAGVMEKRFAGRSAAPGLALGALFPIANGTGTRVASGAAESEAEALRSALSAALSDLSALIERSTEDAAAILEFQVALLEDDVDELSGLALVDAHRGVLIVNPGPAARVQFERDAETAATARTLATAAAMKPAVTADGTTIRIVLNIADPRELSDLDPAICDGIGLVRTEFLFHNQQGLPDEEQQYSTYRRIVEWAHDRPVTIRTLDAGGDKPIPGLTPTGESNPFLGVRGLRLSLAQPDVFRTQLRALARAAMHGNVKIMLPMVTQPRELTAARSIFEAEVAAW